MFAIYEGLARINGVPVETFEREVLDGHTIMRVEAGTTGYKGGCSRDNGGRTYIGIDCLCGDFHFGESSCVDHAAAVACLFDAAIDECAEYDDGDGKDQCFWDASLHFISPYVFVRKIIYLRVKE